MLRYANYQGNAEHMLGEAIVAPYLLKDQPTQTVRWVATDSGWDETTNTTKVEFFGTVLA